MGYVTSFSLKVDLLINGEVAQLRDESPLCSIISDLRSANEWAAAVFDDDGGTAESQKWYDHEKDMREVSKLHPHILFTLHGEGEEGGDIWTKYFLDGKCQTAKAMVQIAPFDPKQLV